MAEFYGVVDKIIEYLMDLSLIGIDHQLLFCIKIQRESNAVLGGSTFQSINRLNDRFMNIEVGQVQKNTFAVKGIQFQKV